MSESRHLDVNSNSIRSHLPNGTSPETTAEGDDRQQDALTKNRQQETIKFTESTKDGVVSDDQLMPPKGQSNLSPDNQPLLFALQRNNGQVTASTATMDSASFHLPAGSTVPETAVVDQMIAQLSTNKRLESGTVNLKLHPQELGELRMETPPRSEAWAVCLGAGLAMIWHMVRNNYKSPSGLQFFQRLVQVLDLPLEIFFRYWAMCWR